MTYRKILKPGIVKYQNSIYDEGNVIETTLNIKNYIGRTVYICAEAYWQEEIVTRLCKKNSEDIDWDHPGFWLYRK